MKKSYQTTVGRINAATLAFTAGADLELDRRLVAADCLSTAAHVAMLAALNLKPKLITPREKKAVLRELAGIIRQTRRKSLQITLADQDVHLAVERLLTKRLGALGKKIHTGRSRNDQAAVDLRLYGKTELLALADKMSRLCAALLRLAARHQWTPMVGRTHLQPAMPSSVGLWAAAYAEGLLDDLAILKNAYILNNRCPLGAAAGYGAPLPLNRAQTAALLGFAQPVHNVLHAGNLRGKMESVILGALAQVMTTLSRLAEDLIIFTMPEFNYFTLPEEMCTGSSIMPQKKNPDILELIRAKAARVIGHAFCALEITRALPSGYSRDLQETKEPLLNGLETVAASVRIMLPLVENMKVNKQALLAGFTPEVFAADHALELAGQGLPFRDAYFYVKAHLRELAGLDPLAALKKKRQLGAPGRLGLPALRARLSREQKYFRDEKSGFDRKIARLLNINEH